jgi:hypothetical protein
MKTIKQNIWLILILIVNLAVVLYPTFSTSLPITQTDGLTYFGTSKMLAETGDFFAELPSYIPAKGEEATHINEFLPVPIVYMAGFIKFFGERITINGGALGLIFVLANFYLYFLVKKLTSKNTALIVTLLSALNFRFYFLLFGGNWANACAMMLSIPTLYYYSEYLETNKKSSLLSVSCFLLLVAGSHTVQFLFTVFLMLGLWFGMKVLKNTKIKFPEIKLEIGAKQEKTIKTVIYTLGISIFAFLVTFIPFVLAGTRTYWVTEWINYLKAYDKVPEFWHYGVLTDGPVLIIFGLLGLLYAIHKQNWKIVGIAIPSFIIINLTNFLVPDEIWLSLFVYRYQAFHFIVLALLSAYFAFEVTKNVPKLKKLFVVLISIGVLWQAGLVGVLMHEVEPAITEDEFAAAEYLKNTDGNFWLINNIDTDSSFRSYEWIFAYGDGDVDNAGKVLTQDALNYDYIMVQDIDVLTEEDSAILETKEVVFDQGIVSIYQNK